MFTIIFTAVRTIAAFPCMFWWCGKVAVMDAPLLHRCIWVAASVGVTLVSQPFTIGFVKDTHVLLTTPSDQALHGNGGGTEGDAGSRGIPGFLKKTASSAAAVEVKSKAN